MKNQGEKNETNLELESLELIHYNADLIGVFIFSGVNTKEKAENDGDKCA